MMMNCKVLSKSSSRMMRPVTTRVNFVSVQKSVKFEWLEACEKTFQVLKDRITSGMVLTLPEGTKGFVVYSDASRVGFGCVLMQHA